MLCRATRFLLVIVLSFFATNSYAKNFSQSPNDALIGNVISISAENGDTPTTIAQRYNLGLNAIIAANPGSSINTVYPAGTTVIVADKFLLPPLPRRGIVINLPEMRLYYYPENSQEVMTFPIGIGRIGKTIPIKATKIARKTVNPIWIPPKDIREFNKQQGITLPRVMAAGPDNPLGPYAIYLGIPSYLIHSTIFPESIGTRASFGCIRMNESDIKEFYPLVKAGVPVMIVDMPNKIAWEGNKLYLEAHPPLEERAMLANLSSITSQIQAKIPHDRMVLINWPLVKSISEQPDGVPHEIGVLVG